MIGVPSNWLSSTGVSVGLVVTDVLLFRLAVYRTLTLAHLEGVGDRGLPSVGLALVAV